MRVLELFHVPVLLLSLQLLAVCRASSSSDRESRRGGRGGSEAQRLGETARRRRGSFGACAAAPSLEVSTRTKYCVLICIYRRP